MKPLLCKAGQQLREQIDEHFPHRDKNSDGWIGDARINEQVVVTTCQIRLTATSGLLMWTRISTHHPIQVLILPTKYVSAPRVMQELPTSYTWEKSHQEKPFSVGSNIRESLLIIIISMSVLLKRAMQTLLHSKSQC